MKKGIYSLILLLIVISGLVFANRENNNKISYKPVPKPLTATEMKLARKKWEASPDGISYKKWEKSPEGRKVLASEAKIKKPIFDYTDMKGIVTSISLPSGATI